MAERRREADRREQAVAELVAVGARLGEVRLSGAALQVLLELLAQATARFGPELAGASAALVDADAVLWMEPGDGTTTLHSAVGDLTVGGFRLVVTKAGGQPAQDVGAPQRASAE